MQNEQAHCVIRVRFSALNSPRHSLQVNLTVGVKAVVVVVVAVVVDGPVVAIGDTGIRSVGLGSSRAAFDAGDAGPLFGVVGEGDGDEEDDDDDDDVDDEQGDEAAEDELDEEQLVVVSRRRLPTCFRLDPLPPPPPLLPVASCDFFGLTSGSGGVSLGPDTDTNAPLDAFSE